MKGPKGDPPTVAWVARPTPMCFCFVSFFDALIVHNKLRYFGKCGLPYPKLFSAKENRREKNLAGQASGWHNINVEHVVIITRVFLLNSAREFGVCA